MSRNVLVIGGVVLAGAVIALVLMLRGGDNPSSTGTVSGDPAGTRPEGQSMTSGAGGADPTIGGGLAIGSAGGTAAGGTGPTAANGQPTGATRPTTGGPPPLDPNAPVVTPRQTPRGQGSANGSSDDYAVGDVNVRDHRGSGQAPIDIPPNIHTPEGPRIASTVTNEIAKQVRAVMFACAKDLSRDGRGDKPRVDGQVVIAVKANQLTVLTAQIQPRDLPAAATTALKTCMEPKIVGVTAAAPDQADLASYSIDLSMALP